ncbi:MAG: hypothetical protein C5B47_07915 [Verrucomicrobia bacterium]|nr:MAG: hypothetical protein C5B47_07915 [Verrucomicrobiota bacterium]
MKYFYSQKSLKDTGVIEFTLRHLPGYEGDEYTVSPLQKGGSGRKYYRIWFRGGSSVILVRYTQERTENAHYVNIAKFLATAGVRVPRIHFHEPKAGLILMEDLGEKDLWSYRHASWAARRPLYESALSQVFLIHRETRLPTLNLKMELEFDERLYLWEQQYFFENCLENIWKVETSALRALPALQKIALRLADLPRTLVHRDFQSQNIIILSGKAYLIDFQGMRPGLGLYDVASLLYDPYADLAIEERRELLEFYKNLCGDSSLLQEDDFETTFLMCAMQRLMQALGAYGFLGLKKQRQNFLQYIPVARRLLREVAISIGNLDSLVETLERTALECTNDSFSYREVRQ